MFYDLFCELCSKKKISPTKASLEIGLSKSTATKWKNTGATPQGETLNKIAAYFDVSADYLLGNEQKEKPAQKVQAKPRLRSIARLEESSITPEQDEEISHYIDFLLNKEKGK